MQPCCNALGRTIRERGVLAIDRIQGQVRAKTRTWCSLNGGRHRLQGHPNGSGVGRGRILVCRWYTPQVCTTVNRAIRHPRLLSRKVPERGRKARHNSQWAIGLRSSNQGAGHLQMCLVPGSSPGRVKWHNEVLNCAILCHFYHWFRTPFHSLGRDITAPAGHVGRR